MISGIRTLIDVLVAGSQGCPLTLGNDEAPCRLAERVSKRLVLQQLDATVGQRGGVPGGKAESCHPLPHQLTHGWQVTDYDGTPRSHRFQWLERHRLYGRRVQSAAFRPRARCWTTRSSSAFSRTSSRDRSRRPSHLLPQVQSDRHYDSRAFSNGILLILSGLFPQVRGGGSAARSSPTPRFAGAMGPPSIAVVALRNVGLRLADLRRLQRVQRHRARLRPAPGLPLHGELPPAVSRRHRSRSSGGAGTSVSARGCGTTSTSRSGAAATVRHGPIAT